MKDYSWIQKNVIVHRGLHDNIKAPENSLLAIKNAVDKGYDIEFDVYLTNDNHLIVHHDKYLKRTCGRNVRAVDIDCNDIESYKLFHTSERVPYFQEVLDIVQGKVNLIIEIKPTNQVDKTCNAIWKVLQQYKGNYGIESFDPFVVRWWAKHQPQITLGQLYENKGPQPLLCKLMAQYRIVDFLAVGIDTVDKSYYQNLRKKYPNKMVVSWTIKTKANQDKAIKYCNNYICETKIKNKDYIDLQ